jgi:hypothetical protein
VDGHRDTPEADPDADEPELGPWPWPMPRHSRVSGYERAAQLLAELDSRWTEQQDRWHGSWIATMTTIVEEALLGGVVRARPSPYPAATWTDLAVRVRALQARAPLAERWLIGVGALWHPGDGDDGAARTARRALGGAHRSQGGGRAAAAARQPPVPAADRSRTVPPDSRSDPGPGPWANPRQKTQARLRADTRRMTTPARGIRLPFEHLMAELAAFPLASGAALAGPLTRLDPMLSAPTATLWRAAERHLTAIALGVSVDELMAMRDSCWFGSDHDRPRTLHAHLRAATDAYLESLGGGLNTRRPALPDSPYPVSPAQGQARQAWMWLMLALPADLLLAASSSDDVLPEPDLCGPPVHDLQLLDDVTHRLQPADFHLAGLQHHVVGLDLPHVQAERSSEKSGERDPGTAGRDPGDQARHHALLFAARLSSRCRSRLAGAPSPSRQRSVSDARPVTPPSGAPAPRPCWS